MAQSLTQKLSSIMDVFRPAPAPTPAPNNTETQQGDPAKNTTVPNSNTLKPDGTGPAAFPKAKDGDESPLANYQELWNIADKDRKQLPPISPPIPVDAKKLKEAAAGIDFRQAIDPEVLKKAAAGNDAEALSAALNQAAQAALVQSHAATAKLVEAALARQAEAFQARIPEILRSHETRVSLRENEAVAEVYNNPAIAPLVNLVENQVAAKFPNAGPEELRKYVSEYLAGASEAIVGASGRQVVDPATAPNKGKGRKETNWENFLTQG